MRFGDALIAIEQGKRAARVGWNGKKMFIYLDAVPNLVKGPPIICPFISMHTAKGECQPGWLASQADMLSHDWVILD